MRNPKWTRDEVILALDLYFKLTPGQMHAKNEDIIHLSKILNKLPIHKKRLDETTFRNPNGVALKLCNFLSIDPEYDGSGMKSYSQLDKKVFYEYYTNRNELNSIANTIIQATNDQYINSNISLLVDEFEEEYSLKEGKVIFRLHKYFERSSKLIAKKKQLYIKKHDKLECELCGFNFFKTYGEIGDGFIECHHIKPLNQINKETDTSLNDLILVCSNCHRMLHRGNFSKTKNFDELVINK